MKKEEPNGGYTQVRASEALIMEPKKSWQRLQKAKEFFFADLGEQMKENHCRFLDLLMSEERQRFLQAHPYKRRVERVRSGQRILPAQPDNPTRHIGVARAAKPLPGTEVSTKLDCRS